MLQTHLPSIDWLQPFTKSEHTISFAPKVFNPKDWLLFQIKVLEIRKFLFITLERVHEALYEFLSLKKWLFPEESRTEQSYAPIFEKICIFPASSGFNMDCKYVRPYYIKNLFSLIPGVEGQL